MKAATTSDEREPTELAPPPGLTVYRSAIDGVEYAVLVFPTFQPDAARDEMLTEAERDVIAMVLDGLPNDAIAARRGTSARTVANQLQSVYRKLGVASRLELTAWVRARSRT